MKQFVTCKSAKERSKLLKAIDKIGGFTWNGGDDILAFEPSYMTIGYHSIDDGITENWAGVDAKETTIERFLVSLAIEKLKKKRRALPKFEQED